MYREGTKNIVADALFRRPDLRVRAISVAQPSYAKDWPALYKKCPDFGKIYAHLIDPASNPASSMPKYSFNNFTLQDGLLWFRKEQLCVPGDDKLRTLLLEEHHDRTYCGHLGDHKTYINIKRNFWWPTLQHAVKRFCNSCEKCKRNKPDRQALAGLLQSLEIPTYKWKVSTLR